MIERYKDILDDRRFLNITEEQIRDNNGNFEAALSDYRACITCKGKCRTRINHRCINPKHESIINCQDECFGNVKACIEIDNQHSYTAKMPMFRVVVCNSVTGRKKSLINKTANWEAEQ